MPRNPAPKKTVSPAAVQPDPPIDEAAGVATIDPPKPAPSKKKAAPPKPSKLLAEEIQRERRLAESREELSFRRHALLADGQDLSPDEYRVLKTAVAESANLGDYDYKERFGHYLKREEKRVSMIIGLQGQAGTPADRAAGDKLAKQTADDRDSQAPPIEEEIRKLQDQLGAVHRAASDAKSAADSRHAADASLRDEKLLPLFIRDELAALHHDHETEFGTELRGLEVRRLQIEGLFVTDAKSRNQLDVVNGGDVDLDVESKAAHESIKRHIEGIPRFGGDPMERLKCVFEFSTEQRPNGISFRFGKIRGDVWAEYIAELRVELGDLETRIAEIVGGSKARADEEIESLKSFYCLK